MNEILCPIHNFSCAINTWMGAQKTSAKIIKKKKYTTAVMIKWKLKTETVTNIRYIIILFANCKRFEVHKHEHQERRLLIHCGVLRSCGRSGTISLCTTESNQRIVKSHCNCLRVPIQFWFVFIVTDLFYCNSSLLKSTVRPTSVYLFVLYFTLFKKNAL